MTAAASSFVSDAHTLSLGAVVVGAVEVTFTALVYSFRFRNCGRDSLGWWMELTFGAGAARLVDRVARRQAPAARNLMMSE